MFPDLPGYAEVKKKSVTLYLVFPKSWRITMFSDTRSTIHGMHIVIAFLLGLALLCIGPKSGEAAQLPTLPQVLIDTTYSPPSGNTITVNAGGNLQTAINNAVPGTTIVLQAGATFTGPFTLPNKTGSGWIYIRSSAYTSLPAPGTRITPADAANMPKIAVNAAGGTTIQTNSQAHHYRFVGIEFKPVANNFVYALITIGNDETSLSNLPHDITFDRCYIHGDPSLGGRRGIQMDGNSIAVIDSYLSDFKEAGADTQALLSVNGAGPFKIVNNYLEAAGENVMFGGAAASITNLTPSDITIQRNHFFKPLSWVGSSWSVKNLLEFKHAQRVLVEGNTFENIWAAAQTGWAIQITPRSEYGVNPWATTSDITFRLNKGINWGGGINISGEDDWVSTNPAWASQRTRRILIENNVMQVSRNSGSDGRIFQTTHGPTDITVNHNTMFTSGQALGFAENTPKADQFVYTNNIGSEGDYGFTGTATGSGTPTLNGHYTNYTFTKNAIIAYFGETYPSGNYFPANAAAVGFVNYAGGDFRLSGSSAYKNAGLDGKDLGANIDALVAALAGVGSQGPTNLRTPVQK